MPNTPASRPDVDTIERRVKLYGAISGKHTLALIAYIVQLEAVVEAARAGYTKLSPVMCKALEALGEGDG